MASGKAVAFRVEKSFTREQPADKGGNWATKKVKKSYLLGKTYPIEALSERDRKWAESKKCITVLKDKSAPSEAAKKAAEEKAAEEKAAEEAELAKMLAEEEAAKKAK